jgi:hypothetical protein
MTERREYDLPRIFRYAYARAQSPWPSASRARCRRLLDRIGVDPYKTPIDRMTDDELLELAWANVQRRRGGVGRAN